MKRTFLSALGLEKAIIDSIMEEHGNTIEALKERHGEVVEAEKEKAKQAVEQVKALQTENKELKAAQPTEDYEAKAAAIQAEFDEYKAKQEEAIAGYKSEIDGYKTKEEDSATSKALRKALLDAGARNDPDVLEFLESKFDKSVLKRDGEKITNWDDVFKEKKDSLGKWFGETRQEGAGVAQPPANPGGGASEAKSLHEALTEKYTKKE